MERRSYLLALAILFAACVTQHDSEEPHIVSVRPTTFPAWATNANYAGGPDVGTPTKVAPSAGRFADGWRNNDIPPPQEQNYWQNQVYQWVSWLDNGYVSGLASLASYSAGQVDRSYVPVSGLGRYQFYTTPPFTADGFWAVDGVGGQWVNENIAVVNLKHVPGIGPVPGDSYPTATPAGRINKANIDHGFFTNSADFANHSYTTNSATAVTLATLTPDLGTLAPGDIVRFFTTATGAGNSAAVHKFAAWMEYSENGGGAWTQITSKGGEEYQSNAANLHQAISLNFVRVVASGGVFQIRIRGYSDGTNNMVLHLDQWYAEVQRP